MTSPNRADGGGEDSRLSSQSSSDDAPSPLESQAHGIHHRKIGVWDMFEDISADPSPIRMSMLLERWKNFSDALPFLVLLAKDVFNIPRCSHLVIAFVAVEFAQAFIPVALIWLEDKTLQSAEGVTVDTPAVDKQLFFQISIGLILSSIVNGLFARAKRHIERPLNARIRRWYALHSFSARARLDLPTYSAATIRRQLHDVSDDLWGQTVVYRVLELATNILSAMAQLCMSVIVLVRAMSDQEDGSVLLAITLFAEVTYWLPRMSAFRRTRVWIATTSNEAYLRMRGWQSTVREFNYRKELVAGGLSEYATSEFKKAAECIGDMDADWNEVEDQVLQRTGSWTIFTESLKHLPQIYFMFCATRLTAGSPVSLASLNLVQATTHRFAFTLYEIIHKVRSAERLFESSKKFYRANDIPNLVRDGTIPFPEDTAQVKSGIELEFRNVSFKYPDAERWALQHISFKLLPGQLCVIVGGNGAGKSTILKLITRLYDPDEGSILVGGHDIRTLKLHDLRRCISVLFQDYTLFPLSIHDNIALGDPTNASSKYHVEMAARLAGAEGFIDKLPKGIDTFLMRPVPDSYSRAVEGSTTASGRVINYESLRVAAGIHSSWGGAVALSGGQIQRLAVARMFMGSVVNEEGTVGLMLFDEPSASLDPVAEHDLFNQLRELRGSKTMLFSSHRFGNLTSFADLILYMDDTGIVESGTHHELLLQKGKYAHLWTLQAEAFL